MHGKELRDPRGGGAGGPQGALPALPSGGRVRVDKPAPHSAPSKATGGLCSGDSATSAILYSLTYGEAPCTGVVGDRGTGKSYAMRAICAAYLKCSVGLVLACDKDGGSGFEGQRRRDMMDLQARPLEPSPRSVVFVGDSFAGVDPNPEEVAAFAWRLAARKTPTCVVVDELKWAARNGWWRKDVKWLPQCCSEGRKHGVGILWASQSPQDAPREAFEEAGVVICYRLAGLGLDRLEERGYLRGLDRALVEDLPGDDSPPSERGRCVILRRGRPWDGKFYRFTI